MTEYLPDLVPGLIVGGLWVFAIWFAVALARANRADAEEEEETETVPWEEIRDRIMNYEPPWYTSLYWAFHRFADNWLNPMSIGRMIKRFFQRRIRGFDDRDVWGLYHAVLKFTAPRLRALAKMDKMGVPPEIYEEVCLQHGMTSEEYENAEKDLIPPWKFDACWNEKLNKMARALELYMEHGGIFSRREGFNNKYVKAPELEKEFNEGWELFKHYFFALWD